ncbi:hypothetical protein AVEN_123864-1 [Araneus ventricosus]|uniref:Uncharacterized protein n=1 Tax=Araneus ventricosus TaxID=182803 RepID=A0A4Y2GEP8_ARAVE|nr:hypothetical protein AVEN_123864-1 [Araneus ventricosus]
MVARAATWSQVHKKLTQAFRYFMDEYSAPKITSSRFPSRFASHFLSYPLEPSHQANLLLFLFSEPKPKKISLHHAPASHFESRGESPSSRQTVILKREKARLELKLFLPRKANLANSSLSG